MSESDKVPLRVLGLAHGKPEHAIYALVLGDMDDEYRVPVIIGSAEAHAIAVVLDGTVSPRPLSPDLFVSFVHNMNMEVKEVFIYRFEEGIFSARITFTNLDEDGGEVTMDSRTSDAVAIALRTKSPIFMDREILIRANVVLSDDPNAPLPPLARDEKGMGPLSDEELRKRLDEAVKTEQYEIAAQIHQELKRRAGEV